MEASAAISTIVSTHKEHGHEAKLVDEWRCRWHALCGCRDRRHRHPGRADQLTRADSWISFNNKTSIGERGAQLGGDGACGGGMVGTKA